MRIEYGNLILLEMSWEMKCGMNWECLDLRRRRMKDL